MNRIPRKAAIFLAVVLGLGALGYLATRSTLGRSTAEGQEPVAAGIPDPSNLRPTRPASPATASPHQVDLLDRIQTDKDAVAGEWGFYDHALFTSGVAWGRLQLPCLPPEEYDLRLRVARKRGVNSLNLGLVIGGRQAMAVIDGGEGKSSWLYKSDSANDYLNETTWNGKLFKWNVPATILVSIRKNSILITVDGTQVMDWMGDIADLQLPSGFRTPFPNALFVGSWETIFRIDELTLLPVTGTPTFTR